MEYFAEALEWKYGPVADTFDGKITAWKHETEVQPTEKDYALLVEEYKKVLPAIEAEKEKQKEDREVQKQELLNRLGLSTEDVALFRDILSSF